MFISLWVRTNTDGTNNFSKVTVGMIAIVLDNPPAFDESSFPVCTPNDDGITQAMFQDTLVKRTKFAGFFLS